MPSLDDVFLRAAQLFRESDLPAAEKVCQEILKADPAHPAALHMRGVIARKNGQFELALQFLKQSIAQQPQNPVCHANLGVTYQDLGKTVKAVEAYREAVRLFPNYPDALNNLGNALRALGYLEEAEQYCRQAASLLPAPVGALNNLGNIMSDFGKLDEALEFFRKAISFQPPMLAAHSNLLFTMNYHPDIDREELFAEHRRWQGAHAYQGETPAHANDRNPDRPLRVGYVSPDFRNHAVACFLEPIFTHHDPAQVEAYAYAQIRVPDAVSERFRALSRGWSVTCGLTDEQMVEQIRRDRIDILVDLAAHSGENRLRAFTYKPAPIQVTYLGYPNTTGLSAIDYRLTDPVADPPEERSYYSEELVRLPGCFCCYRPAGDFTPRKRWRLEKGGVRNVHLESEFPAPNPLLADRKGYVTFGSLHNLAKLNPRVLDAWAAIMRAVPDSRLLIFRHLLTDKLREDLLRRFAERGIAAERLELGLKLLPGRRHWNFYWEFDISLDTFPWGGHTTACESLWMGVPMVTLRGNRHAGRMVASVLTSLKMTDWIAETPEQYVDLAVQAAGDLPRLRALRASLRQRMQASPLCDGPRFTQELERIYREMWRSWCEK